MFFEGDDPGDVQNYDDTLRARPAFWPAFFEHGRRQAAIEKTKDVVRTAYNLSAAHGARFIFLTPTLLEAVRGGAVPYYPDDDHWEPDDRRIAAEAISGYLSPARLTQISARAAVVGASR
jgi:hypothetical protein